MDHFDIVAALKYRKIKTSCFGVNEAFCRPREYRGSFPLDAHPASAHGFELDDAFLQCRCLRRDQLDECRLDCPLSESGNSAHSLLHHVVQP
jgi:hypothetical protein